MSRGPTPQEEMISFHVCDINSNMQTLTGTKKIYCAKCIIYYDNNRSSQVLIYHHTSILSVGNSSLITHSPGQSVIVTRISGITQEKGNIYFNN